MILLSPLYQRPVRAASSVSRSASASDGSPLPNLLPRSEDLLVASAPNFHQPTAIEHRWPEHLVSGPAVSRSHPRARLVARRHVHNIAHQGAGSAATDPILIDDSSVAAARSTRRDVQVVVLSDDSD